MIISIPWGSTVTSTLSTVPCFSSPLSAFSWSWLSLLFGWARRKLVNSSLVGKPICVACINVSILALVPRFMWLSLLLLVVAAIKIVPGLSRFGLFLVEQIRTVLASRSRFCPWLCSHPGGMGGINVVSIQAHVLLCAMTKTEYWVYEVIRKLNVYMSVRTMKYAAMTK